MKNAQSIEEAFAFAGFKENESEQPLAWSPDKPLCRHCWQDLAQEGDLCLTCKSMLPDARVKVNAGILFRCEKPEQFVAENGITHVLSRKELLILSPSSSVASIVLSFEGGWKSAVVFPGRGDMLFGDALAMARYFATEIAGIKIFFSHSHMRTLELNDVLEFDLAQKLFGVAATLQSVFLRDDLFILSDILRKDRMNKKYELSRFYSMCSQDQKELLDQLQITEINPARANLLLQLVRYV